MPVSERDADPQALARALLDPDAAVRRAAQRACRDVRLPLEGPPAAATGRLLATLLHSRYREAKLAGFELAGRTQGKLSRNGELLDALKFITVLGDAELEVAGLRAALGAFPPLLADPELLAVPRWALQTAARPATAAQVPPDLLAVSVEIALTQPAMAGHPDVVPALAAVARTAQPVQSREARRYELRGRILGGSRCPERCVQVLIEGAALPFRARTSAGSEGRFRLGGLQPGTYVVTVTSPGRGFGHQTVEVGSGSASRRGRVEVLVELRAPAWKVGATPAGTGVSDRVVRLRAEAEARLARRDTAGAVALLERAVARAPRFEDAWTLLGGIAQLAGDYGRAERCFREALTHSPGSAAALAGLGGALLGQGRAAEALAFNEQAVERSPDDPLGHAQLGLNCFQVAQLDRAVAHLERAKALDPAHFWYPQIVLAQIHLRRGDTRKTVEELEDVLVRHPDSPLAPSLARSVAALRGRLP